MKVSIRFSNEEFKLVKSYAKDKNMTVSGVIRNAMHEKIEDEYDLEAYNKAIKKIKKNPKKYTFSEAKKIVLN